MSFARQAKLQKREFRFYIYSKIYWLQFELEFERNEYSDGLGIADSAIAAATTSHWLASWQILNGDTTDKLWGFLPSLSCKSKAITQFTSQNSRLKVGLRNAHSSATPPTIERLREKDALRPESESYSSTKVQDLNPILFVRWGSFWLVECDLPLCLPF